MAYLQIKNIPDSLHNRLKKQAKKQNCTMKDIVLEAVERELARSEWLGRVSKRPRTDLGVSAASLLEEERKQRNDEFS